MGRLKTATAVTAVTAAAAWWYYSGAGSFSPDGTKVAYVSNESGGDRVRVVDADGTGKHVIPREGYIVGEPHFVDVGAKIIICSWTLSSADPNVYVVDVDGSNLRRLTDYAVGDWVAGTFPTHGYVKTGFVRERRAGEIIYYVDRFYDADDPRGQPDTRTREAVSRDYVALDYNGGAATVLAEGAS